MQLTELLAKNEIDKIHDASLDILENVGLLVRNDKAKEIFSKHGIYDADTEIVKFPRKLVEDSLKAISPKFTFYARNPLFDKILPDARPVIVTGSSAPNMLDPVSRQERRAFSDDIARMARLINELPGYDVFSISTLAEDAPMDRFTVTRVYPALKNCVKPIRVSTSSESDARQLLQLCYAVAGSEAAYRERPFVTHHYCPIVSPLAFDLDSTAELIFYAEENLPSYATIVPNGGMSSPLTLLGTLAQGNAEFLAFATLTQMIRPGKAVIYSSLPTIADMRRGSYAPGAIETAMLMMGMAQLSRKYNVPNGGYIGLTNAKINDAQSGYETAASTFSGLLGGVDMFNMGGLLDALMCFDFAKAAIDDEIAMMMKRVQRGYESDDAMSESLDVIREAGPAGMFLDKPQTYALMKETMLLTDIADRNPRNRWQKLGSHDADSLAMNKVREILTRDHASLLDADADARARKIFPDLPKGDCVAPKGWEREIEQATA